jgi:hypothetical protein
LPTQAPQTATVIERVITQVTITSPQHPLFGHTFPIVSLQSPRHREHIIVELADGRRRSIPRAATDLQASSSTGPQPEKPLPKVSVRTLLPLARYLRAMLTLSEEVSDENTAPTVNSADANDPAHLAGIVAPRTSSTGQTTSNSDPTNAAGQLAEAGGAQ